MKLLVLRKKQDFLKLKQEGLKVRKKFCFILYRKNQCSDHRLALSIPRYTGSAVQRNKMKRWVREFFRKNPLPGFPKQDMLVGLQKRDKNFYKVMSYEKFCQLLKELVCLMQKS